MLSVLLEHELLSRYAFSLPSGSQVEAIPGSLLGQAFRLACLPSLASVVMAVGFPVLGFEGVTDRVLGFAQLH